MALTYKYYPVYVWQCTVCGQKFHGKNPPFHCQNCSSETNRHILVPPENSPVDIPEGQNSIGLPGLNNLLYLVGSVQDGRANAMCCSSVTQVTYGPARVAVAVNKNNFTHDYIKVSGVLSISLLSKEQGAMAHHFGRNSGRQINKFESYSQRPGKTGSPIIEGCPDYFDCRVNHNLTMDLASHTLFIAEIVEANINFKGSPLTYFEYLKHLSNYSSQT